ncbi:RNA polymerase sigma-I factor [Paenibacillus sp. CMAA1364]
MLDRPIEDILKNAQQGMIVDRELLIKMYHPYIIRVVTHICKRPIDWNQDESSIGLIAFNDAIDRFDETHSKTFDNFAYMIIRNRLVDEFRRQGKMFTSELLIFNDVQEEFEQTVIEIASSMEAFDREQAATALMDELIIYDQVLQDYGITLEELEDCSPKHRDTRIQFIQMAKYFIAQSDWIISLEKTKRLPIKEMLRHFKVSRKTIERNRKYLIALVLIYTNDEFGRIRNTVSFVDVGE